MKPLWELGMTPVQLLIAIILYQVKDSASYVPVRLVGGATNQEGRLEVFHDGLWGTVCDDSATNDLAIVVCSHLGFSSGHHIVKGNAYFGAGTGRIWMDDVRCSGTEESIEDCRFNGWGNNVCSHSEDLSVICKQQYVTRINPHTGSVLGGTRVTIEGEGFSTDSFNYFPGTEDLSNKAFFVNDHYVFPCEVIVDRTTSTRIVCLTIADMPYGNEYRIQVNVDGIDIDNRCGYSSYCSYKPSLSSTPTITSIDPLSGVPGSLLTIKGKIFTSEYGTTLSTNRGSEEIARAMAGGDICDLMTPDGNNYGITLHSGSDGSMICKLSETGSRIGNINATYELSMFGRSQANLDLFKVSRNGQTFMFQSFAEIHSITPAIGSTEGGTIITLAGRFFDESKSGAVVKIGGMGCEVLSINGSVITCRTPRAPDKIKPKYIGNRGIVVESWTDTYLYHLTEINNLNESSPHYQTTTMDTSSISRTGYSGNSVHRMKGFFHPPFDGEYSFAVKSEREAQFYLSMDEDPANMDLLMTNGNYYGTGNSNRIPLMSNTSYYMELLYKFNYDINVAAKYYDSIVNHYMSGNVKQEEQQIHLHSDFVKEQQAITIPVLTQQAAIYEQQEILIQTLDDSSEGELFRVGLYSVFTENIRTTASAIEMENALLDLPIFEESETVLVNRTMVGRDLKYTITFVSERGDFPILQLHTSPNSVEIIIKTLRNGVPSGRKLEIMMADVPAPLIDSNSSLSQVSGAIKELFTSRCPSYWTHPKQKAIHYNMEEQHTLPSYMQSYFTTAYPAFCGDGALLNPYYLFNNDQRINLTINPMFCMAYKGDIAGSVSIYIDYTDQQDNKLLDSGHTFYNLIQPKQTKQWNYECFNLKEHMEAVTQGATNMVLRKLILHQSSFVLIDEIYIGEQVTTADTNDVHVRRLVCEPNGFKITHVDVVGSEDNFDVTLTPVHGDYGFPLFTINQVTSDTSVFVTRKIAASPPLSGTFDLTLKGQTKTGIPVGIDKYDLAAILENFDGIGVVKPTYYSNDLFDIYWWFRFDTYIGNLEEIKINASSMVGINPMAEVFTETDGHYSIDPLYGEMLQTVHDTPQVTVTINDIPSNCTGDCGYEWMSSRTPVIQNVTLLQDLSNTTIQITGTGFSSMTNYNTITIGAIICNVTEATNTSLTCTSDVLPSGEHEVTVDVFGKGLARYDAQNFTVHSSIQIHDFHPTCSGLGGLSNLTITGYGFEKDSTVKLGEKICVSRTVTSTMIVCQIPSTHFAGNVSITLDHPGTNQLIHPVKFAYNSSTTPRVESVYPTSMGVTGGSFMEIRGSGFNSAAKQITLLIGDTKCNITRHNDSLVVAELPPCYPGRHEIKILINDAGAALNKDNELPSVECVFEVTGVNPSNGSVYGGTTLTVTGKGFIPTLKVKAGSLDCDVTNSSDNQFICQIRRTQAVHYINNHGIHPNFGKYYYWKPQHVKILVGDVVRWDWDFPFYITTMKPRVEETYNLTTKYGKPGGFSSGDVGSTTGSYSRQFSKAGTFYFWSGFLDSYQTTWFHGSVEVSERVSDIAPISLSIGETEATYIVNETTNTLGDTTSMDTEAVRNGCADAQPVSATHVSYFEFAFWTCRSPVVTKISRQNGTIDDDIILSGTGLSDNNCSIKITFGDYICKVKTCSESSIVCRIDPKHKPKIGRPQYLDVLVYNTGFAHIDIDQSAGKTFVLFPMIRAISPTNGSQGGNTKITIKGSGFVEGNQTNTTSVTIGGYPCAVTSTRYTDIECLSPRSVTNTRRNVSVIVSSIDNEMINAVCNGDCQFSYDDSVTPIVSNMIPPAISGDDETIISINGTGFGETEDHVHVMFKVSSEQHSCLVVNVSDSQINCQIINLPLGYNSLLVNIEDKGRALIQRNGGIYSPAFISSISPNLGSIFGGLDLTITGNGFLSDVTVNLGSSLCDIRTRSISSVVCTTSPYVVAGKVQVTVRSKNVVYPSKTFLYTPLATPTIQGIYPTSGTSGQNITITGSNLGMTSNGSSVTIGGEECTLMSLNETEAICTVGYYRAGTYDVLINVDGMGRSNDDFQFSFNMTVASISPSVGSIAGGQQVTITGAGFDHAMTVTICDQLCYGTRGHSSSTSHYICDTPAAPGSIPNNCTVSVNVNNVIEKLPDAYKYDETVTPVISDVTPTRGGTQGGTKITISGSNFGIQDMTKECASQITVSGTLCNITVWSNTRVVCVTEAHTKSEKAFIKLQRGCNGTANATNAGFHFVDVWSSVYTWGGATLGLPTAGDIVVIKKGQTIMLDIDTPILKVLVIQGGELIFDETDVELQAENILITEGGHLQIGTEGNPFQHNAVITLHGHFRSKELPIYGTKSLAVREGTLDLHGKHVPITWTKLAETAHAGDSEIKLQKAVTWEIGSTIVIATTGGTSSQFESEVFTIHSVKDDNRTIRLNKTLSKTHLGVTERVADRHLDFKAEVGLLSRNVVIRGFQDSQWMTNVKNCPDGYHGDFNAKQKCNPGRGRANMGRDNFGAQVMIHTTDPRKHLTTSRVQYVEFYHVGQAFRSGRHPLYFHATGDMSNSYVRGCSFHKSFNRAINIGETTNLLVDNNVIYDISGGAIVMEEGSEIGNILQYNLVVLVKSSVRLKSNDITPASFWIANPNNTIRHNSAVGGSNMGYWFQLDPPSVTGSNNLQYKPLGEFNNNTAHSFGWYGLTISPGYYPPITQYHSSSKAAVLRNFQVWNCKKGLVLTDMGSIQVKGLTAVNNVESGFSGNIITRGNRYSDYGPLIEDSFIAGYVPGVPSLGCTNRGILCPYRYGFIIRNVSLVNFDRPNCSALAVTRIPGKCLRNCGGFMYKTQNLTFLNVTNRVHNDWIWESVFEDEDGSLCGNRSCRVVSCSESLPPSCTLFSNSSTLPLCVCPPDVRLIRFAVYYTRYIYSYSTLRLTNQFGTTDNNHRSYAIFPSSGWMSLMVSEEPYLLQFSHYTTLTNVSWDGYFYRMQYDDYVIITQSLTGKPDRIVVNNRQINALNETLDPQMHYHGDWEYNETTGNITYLVSYRQQANQRDEGPKDIYVHLEIMKCFFLGCITPTSPPTTTPLPTTSAPIMKLYWSSPSSWPNNTLPVTGDDIIISHHLTTDSPTTVNPVSTTASPAPTTVIPANATTRSDIECESDLISLHVPLGLLPSGQQVTWNDPSCVVANNGTHLTGSIGLGDCGTYVVFNDSHVTFENELVSHAGPRDGTLEPQSGIDFGAMPNSVIVVQCVYPRREQESLAFRPVQGQVRFFEKTLGHMLVHMRQARDVTFADTYARQDEPRTVHLNDEVFIKLTTDQGNVTTVAINVDRCLATPSPSPLDTDFQELTNNGCPAISSVRIHNSPATEVHLSFHAFQFTSHPGAPVYIHCEVYVCPLSNPHCVTGCTNVVARSRRAATGGIKTHLVSTGPFPVTDEKEQGIVGQSTALIAVTGLCACLAVAATVFGIMAWRGRRRLTAKETVQ